MQIAIDAKLTPAENRVLQLIIENPLVTITKLAAMMGSGARTVQFHCSNVYAKLGVGNRKGLNVFLVARGYNAAEDMITRELDTSGAYILRLETAIRAWVHGDDQRLRDIASELA